MIKKYKPTSPGVRTRKTLVINTTTSKPYKPLTKHLKGGSGRSNGRISTRHREVGSKKLYRIIDFKRNKLNIPATVTTIEYDPNRGTNIALVTYKDGEKRYILCPEGLKVGSSIMASDKAEFNAGNTLPLSSIPLGMPIHNVELNPGAGGVMVRGAGNYAMITAKEGRYVNIKLPSNEVKKVLARCVATIGSLSNQDLRLTQMGKAGKNRHKGFRPAVRGVAMANPSDHPHAGSYKDNGIGMPSPKSPWGQKTRGLKTRRRKSTNYTIVKSRHDAKKKRK